MPKKVILSAIVTASILLGGVFVVKAQTLTGIDFNSPAGRITGTQYSGNASTTTRLLSNGSNCAGGNSFALGVNEFGAAECGTVTDTRLGTLSTSYVPRWNGSALANGLIFDNTTNVGVNTIIPLVKLTVNQGAYGWPLTSGTAQTYGAFRLQAESGGNVTLDMGVNGSSGAWLQTTNRSDLSQKYPLILNPNGGNVGIATTNPTTQLYVNGTGIIRNNTLSFSNAYDIVNKSYVDSLVSAATSSITLWGGTTGGNVWNLNSGNVGIGVASPGNKLTVSLPVGSANTLPALGANGGSFGLFSDGAKYGLIVGVLGSGNVFMQSQRVDGTATAYNMLIQPSGGNVGIGTTNPVKLLTIENDSATFRLQSSTNPSGYYTDIINNHSVTSPFSIYVNNYGTVMGVGRPGGYSGTSIPYVNGYYGSAMLGRNNFGIFVDPTGSVGIGTTNPGQKLHVVSTSAGAETFPIIVQNADSTTGTKSGIAFSASSASTRYSAIEGIQENGANAIGLGFITGQGATINEKMRLDASGNLGIGTTAPATQLYVNGTGIIRNNTLSFSNAYDIVNKSYVDSLVSAATSSITLWGGTTGGNVWNLNSGNVGIGTTNPGAKLDISSGYGNGLILGGDNSLYTRTDATTKYGRMAVPHYTNAEEPMTVFVGYSAAAENGLQVGGGTSVGNAATLLQFFTAANNTTTLGTERMRIDSAGNVGIGTTNPATQLYINGTGIARNNTLSFSNSYDLINKGYVDSLVAAATSSITLWGGTTGGNVWNLNSGNVGIGTTNPTQGKLQIAFPDNIDADNILLTMGGTSDNYGKFSFIDRVTGGYASPTILKLKAVSNLGTIDNIMVWSSNGNVGVGITSPVFKLDVGVGSTTWSNWKSYSSGVIGANSLTGPAAQKINARATAYAYIAGKNPGLAFSLYLVAWDGVNDLETNCNNQVNPSWHAQVAVKGNFYSQTFDNTDFTNYSSIIGSQASFDSNKSYGNQWWIGCSTLPAFSQTGNAGSGTANYLTKWTDTHTQGNSIMYDNATNIGIGTTNPGAKLDIAGPANGSGANLRTVGDIMVGTGTGATIFFDGNYNYTAGNYIRALTTNTQTFVTSGSERLRIAANGNVGISSSTPSTQLVIAGTGIARNTTMSFSNDYDLVNRGYVNAVVATATSSITLWGGTTGGNVWSLNSGNVGIGLTNPIQKLEIAGALKLGNTASVCDSTQTGTFKYDSVSGQSYLCDGKRWLNQKNCGLMTDADGNSYGTVQIGGQCWMAENINVGAMLASGATLPNTGDQVIEKWCYNNDQALCALEGGLYHWDEAMRGSQVAGAQGICPSGWHVPTDAEYNILEKTVQGVIASPNSQYPCDFSVSGWRRCADDSGTDTGGTYGVGKSLKSVGIGGGVGAGNDLVGFAAKLPGYRSTDSSFYNRGSRLNLWSSTPSGSNAWSRGLNTTYSTVSRNANNKAYGFSVRCLRD